MVAKMDTGIFNCIVTINCIVTVVAHPNIAISLAANYLAKNK